MQQSSHYPLRFQFSLRSMLIAVLFAATGLGLLLASTGPLWHFTLTTASAGASFGAAVGNMLGRTGRWAAYGLAMGILFVAYAAAV